VAALEVGGRRIAYARAGDGPLLLLLHGYVGDGPSTWGHQLRSLSDEFTVVAWDAPGAGGSSDPPEALGMSGYADCLAAFIDRLGLGRPHVVGLSFGGALALALADRHPAVPRSLVLVSAYAGWLGSLPAEVAAARLQQALTLADLPPDRFASELMPTMFAVPPPGDLREPFEAAVRAFHPAGFRAMAQAVSVDLHGALARVAVPTLLVCGARDVRAPATVAEDLHASIRGSRLVVLPETGHLCPMERPDDFDREVRRFLRAQPS
jgi:pimeloyl-ACP methyl ester carboxylesterase